MADTQPLAPTDAELLAEWDRVSRITDAGERRLACMRAVLAKWGAPAGAGEVVAHRLMRKSLSGEWESDAWDWNDGPPSMALVDSVCADKGRWRIDVAYAAPTAQTADSVLEDAARLDWLALAGPTSICVVIDREHDGEVEVSTDDVTGYGKTLREALDAARKQGANHD